MHHFVIMPHFVIPDLPHFVIKLAPLCNKRLREVITFIYIYNKSKKYILSKNNYPNNVIDFCVEIFLNNINKLRHCKKIYYYGTEERHSFSLTVSVFCFIRNKPAVMAGSSAAI